MWVLSAVSVFNYLSVISQRQIRAFPVYSNHAFPVKLFDFYLIWVIDFFFYSVIFLFFPPHVGFLNSLLLHYYLHPY